MLLCLVSRLLAVVSEAVSVADQILTFGNILKLYIQLPEDVFLFLIIYFMLD